LLVRVQPGELTFAALLAGLAGFELWNHATGPWPLAAALAPDLARGRSRRVSHSVTGPFALGIAGFWAPRGHRLQVAALAWAAHVYLHRALGYDARD
jgi:hypothetical protein